MQAAKLEKYRTKLRALASQLRTDIATVEEGVRGAAGGQGAGELSNVPMHLGDMGTEEYLRDLNATLLENEEYLFREVADAMQRVEEGSYGRCEACEEDIREERLEVLPYARFCVRCAEKQSSGVDVNINRGRPQNPRDTLAPEGEMRERRLASNHSEFAELRADAPLDPLSEDRHAAGTAGGGTALGGLAGVNAGHGDPTVADLQEAMGSGEFDLEDARHNETETPRSGRSGGAVGGTPANKRAK